MIPTVILAMSFSWLGGDVAVPLLKDSKNQPALAVVAGTSLYFAEAVALDEPAGACRARDLYRVRIGETKEERVATLPCVSEVRSFGDAVYVVHRPVDGERQATKVAVDKIDETFADTFAKAKARVAWNRATAGLPRRPGLTFVGLATAPQALWGIFHAGGEKPGLVAEALAFTGDKAPEAVTLPAERNAPQEVAVTGNGVWLAFRASTAGVELVRFDLEAGTVLPFAGRRPLPKDWKEAAEDKYFARAPRFLVAGATDAFLADRTDQIFTEASSIAAFTASAKRFRRLMQVPGEDVGGLQAVHGGLLVTKPLDGHVIWYGPRTNIPTAFAALVPAAKTEANRNRSGGKQ